MRILDKNPGYESWVKILYTKPRDDYRMRILDASHGYDSWICILGTNPGYESRVRYYFSDSAWKASSFKKGLKRIPSSVHCISILLRILNWECAWDMHARRWRQPRRRMPDLSAAHGLFIFRALLESLSCEANDQGKTLIPKLGKNYNSWVCTSFLIRRVLWPLAC